MHLNRVLLLALLLARLAHAPKRPAPVPRPQPQCDTSAHEEAMKLVVGGGGGGKRSIATRAVVEPVTDLLGRGCLDTPLSRNSGMPMSSHDPFHGLWRCVSSDDDNPYTRSAYRAYITTCMAVEGDRLYPGPGVYPIPGVVEIVALQTCLDNIPYIARLYQRSGSRRPLNKTASLKHNEP